uniref:Putative tethering factor for nuclear proteasome sts1 n=1 Tax=Xenopsylla cheopis TaxID=163159 RepID=A0A6M2DMQ1_XENCH
MDALVLDPLRRTTRSALAEIPIRLGLLRVTPLTPPATPTNNNLAQNVLRNTLTPTTLNISESNLSPVLSPDEFVIQQRGRRRIPVTWSPDNFKKSGPPAGNRTPQNSPSKLNNNTTSLRTTPRKRLILQEQLEITPEKKYVSPGKKSPLKHSPLIKRAKLDLLAPKPSRSIDCSLKGLSNEQLIDVIKSLVNNHPEIEDDLKHNLPAPDLKVMEEKLNYLKRNIYKSIPSSRLTSRTDSQAYSRASIHVTAFKKLLLDQVKLLNEGQHWDSLLDYVFISWSYVRSTPLWDNHAHNAMRRLCFKTLVAHCLQALKNSKFSPEKSVELFERFRSMSMDCEDALNCAKMLDYAMHMAK